MKIYLFGWFGYDNTGDNLILRTELHYLSNIIQKNDLTIIGDDSSLRKLLGGEYRFHTLAHTGKNYIKMFFQADYIIYGGGGLFPHQNTKQVVLLALLQMILKLRRRKIMFIGLGVGGKQTRVDLLAWKAILSMSEGAYFRDDILLQQMKVKDTQRVAAMPDIVFSYNRDRCLPAADKIPGTVCVSLANIFGEQQDHRRAFVKEIAAFLQNLMEQGYRIRLFAFTKQSDEQMNREVCELLDSDRCESILYSDQDEMLADFLSAEYIIAMRFHACVLATIAGTPFLSISYSHKTQALCESFGLENYMLKFCCARNVYYGEEILITAQQMSDAFGRVLRDTVYIKEQLSFKQKSYPDMVEEKFKILKSSIEVN